MRPFAFIGLSLTLSVVAGCGSNGGDSVDAATLECPTTGRYFPVVPGTVWTFRTTDLGDGTIEVKTQAVGALEDVGGTKAGTMAYRMTTTKPGGMVVSWQEDTGDRILRHREQDMAGSGQSDEIYDPHKLRVDETAAHTALDATWTETYDEISTPIGSTIATTTSKTETWTVEAVDEEVTVPAGTFCALRVRKVVTSDPAASAKTYWFVRGIGKVKEEGDSRLEQLTEYSAP
ncbi:MAG TPA: hypothetical protein VML75_00325 [Kofleriaceae bacterium]|nr:hypothetical protein [Kofleriaceae bacterium]